MREISVSQGNSEFYNENSEVNLIDEEEKNEIVCRHCGDKIEDESNVYYENEIAFCCEVCSQSYELERVNTLQDEQDREDAINGK